MSLHLGLKEEEIPLLIARLQENLPYSVAAGGLVADRRMYLAKWAKEGP